MKLPGLHRHSKQPNRQRKLSATKRWLRRIAIASLASGWLGVLALAVPLVAHGDTSNLASYAASASGWAIQPYVVNDEFINIPAADQTVPYVFVSIDNTPSADAKAAYFTPGTAINAVLTTENTGKQVPNGVEARSPGNGSASSQVGPVSDGVATQASAATESAQAAEAYAQATAGLASYQFAPQPGTSPPPVGGGAVPTLPVPTTPPLPGGGLPGGGATPTPTAPPSAKPTPSPTCALPLCLGSAPGASGSKEHVQAAPLPAARVQLPDLFEQRLVAALRTAELANPALLKLAGGHLAAAKASQPYAAADVSGQAVTRASNNGVTVTVTVHAAHVELLQGLITFAGVDSTLQGFAPASNGNGQVTITTTITHAAIGGIPVTVDQHGVQVNGQGGAQTSSNTATLSQALNSALKTAGIQMALTRATTILDAGKFQGTGGGLEVKADFAPGNGVPASHVDFTLGQVTGTAYAVPGSPSSSGPGGFGFGGGGGGFGSFTSGLFGNPTASATPGSHTGGGILNIPEALGPGELLALLAIVQGFSTAAVAATASNAETAAKAGQLLIEEESR